MCEPTTLLIAGAVLGAVGSVQQGFAAQQQSEFNAQVARNNQVIAQRKADDARTRGIAEERKNQIASDQLLGEQRAAAAAAGVDVNVGSAADLQADTVAFGRLDDLTIRNNAERAALGFEAQGTQFGIEAQAQIAAGKNAATAGFLNAGSSLLSASSVVASKWQPKTPALPPPGFDPRGRSITKIR